MKVSGLGGGNLPHVGRAHECLVSRLTIHLSRHGDLSGTLPPTNIGPSFPAVLCGGRDDQGRQTSGVRLGSVGRPRRTGPDSHTTTSAPESVTVTGELSGVRLSTGIPWYMESGGRLWSTSSSHRPVGGGRGKNNLCFGLRVVPMYTFSSCVSEFVTGLILRRSSKIFNRKWDFVSSRSKPSRRL